MCDGDSKTVSALNNDEVYGFITIVKSDCINHVNKLLYNGIEKLKQISRNTSHHVVIVRLPRPMEGNGVTPIFRSLQNCQFYHRRLESLEHFNVLDLYISFGALRSLIFGPYGCQIFFYKFSPFFAYIFIFASTLCMCVMYLTSI